jgi:hypothetical protein
VESTTAECHVSWQYGKSRHSICQRCFQLASAERVSYTGVKRCCSNANCSQQDLFLTNITDYQQAVRVLDVYIRRRSTTTASTLHDGDRQRPARAERTEVDGVFASIRYLRPFCRAYTDARYHSSQPAQPVENDSPARRRTDVPASAAGRREFSFNTPRISGPDSGTRTFTPASTPPSSAAKSDNSLSD